MDLAVTVSRSLQDSMFTPFALIRRLLYLTFFFLAFFFFTKELVAKCFLIWWGGLHLFWKTAELLQLLASLFMKKVHIPPILGDHVSVLIVNFGNVA